MRGYILLFILVCSLIFTSLGFKPALADIITLKDRSETYSGKIISETGTEMTVKLKTGGTARFPKSWVKDIKKEDIPESELYTKQDIYLKKFESTDPKDAQAQLALAEWCLKNSTPENHLSDMAIVHFNKAKELDPNIADESGKDLKDAVDKKAGELYKWAEVDFNIEQYFNSERMLVSIIADYPESAYADKSKDLLKKMWGGDTAFKILNAKDGLPDVVFSRNSLSLTLSQLGDDNMKDKYLAKCINRAKDYEKRAGEVASDKKLGYYRFAINCYEALSSSDKPEVREIARSRVQLLLKGFFEGNPVPRDDAKLAEMEGYLNIVEDKDFVSRVADGYFKIGEDSLYKRAKKLKQPFKAQKAEEAFFCYSLANNFSRNEKIREVIADRMSEAQILERSKR